jgi:hypothetical protein
MVLLIGVFAGLMTHTRLDLAITSGIISIGISYGLAILAIFLIGFFSEIIAGMENDLLVSFLFPIIQFTIITLLFSVTRLKRGILFLKEKGAGIVGLAVSGIILITIIIFSNPARFSWEIRWLFFIGTILSIIGIIVWWRWGLTNLYRRRIREREKRELEEENVKLRESSEYMAAIMHRDNKLLVALHEAAAVNINEDIKIHKQIDALMRERMDAISRSQHLYKPLPTTKDKVLDGVMKVMLTKAAELGIQFDITLFGELGGLIEMVEPIKLNALLADLIENAIIATSYSDYRRVLIMMGSSDGIYKLTVQDSGIPFEAGTLMKLGQEKASTHLDEGGSGIGYMEIFKILREYEAAIIITEHPPKKFSFTKTVTVRLDGKHEYVVQTYRKDELLAAQSASGAELRIVGLK